MSARYVADSIITMMMFEELYFDSASFGIFYDNNDALTGTIVRSRLTMVEE